MDPLLKTVLLRSLAFLLWILFSAWLFSMVEYTDKDDVEEKYQLLLSLYDSMASKYNMTIDEFNNFSNLAHEALIDPKPQWSYSAAVDFVFQSLTTIGELKYELAEWRFRTDKEKILTSWENLAKLAKCQCKMQCSTDFDVENTICSHRNPSK